ncbi:Ribosomal large subunit pseudouridine synthase B [Aquimixticola soesokkakensis]|uniref:Pseudouridine synthase n=1 Tax=Aquimixticola soesokkakensis TaxID=1519096 RepID=A0A1Y5TAE0_9RHOB|nr:pseudouridine synthase [Aquimixticola soesokkakensis]SLN58979.1 Ribosomal large subunit pseudouridine synthase B [Aquimixticola soesokkakensis]
MDKKRTPRSTPSSSATQRGGPASARGGKPAPKAAPKAAPKTAPVRDTTLDGTPKTGGDRIAKVLARHGIASRRDAEKIISEGRVSVNGAVITSPALNVQAKDNIVVDGKLLGTPDVARLWLYHKPTGLVTSARDEKGRETVFDALPADLPRVMSVGRLDLNSEGLLLLTNDGDLKRRLELPSTGWLRKYRVRVKGNPSDADLEPLRQGVTIEGERFQPMTVSLDRHQGANAWLTISIREGKNREIRRALESIGVTVNRLLRVSYGPFRLGELREGEVEEVKTRVLRDQLGMSAEDVEALDDPADKPRRGVSRPGKPAPRKPFGAQASRERDAKPEFKSKGFRSHGGKPDGKGGKGGRALGFKSHAGPNGTGAQNRRDGKPKPRS